MKHFDTRYCNCNRETYENSL